MDGSLIARNASRKSAHHVDLNERTVKNAAPPVLQYSRGYSQRSLDLHRVAEA